jgi:HlyD family secretion protein
MKKAWKVIIIIVVVIVVLALGLRQCGKAALKKIAQTTTSQTYTVVKGDIVSKVEITGKVQPETIISLKSKVAGKIVKFYADVNDYVKSGQIIADIEPDYNQANTLLSTKKQLEDARTNLTKAQADVDNNKVLLDKDYISRDVYKASEDALKYAKTEYERAAKSYDMIADLDVPGKVVHVFATSSGKVLERSVNEGEMVQSSLSSYGEGTVVMKIADLSKMIVKSNINEVDIAKFSVGQEAQIKLDALPYDDYVGTIVKIAPAASTENSAQVFAVEISINATGETVKPGMTAAVTIIGEAHRDVLIIPIRAVFSDDKNQDVVYLMPKTTAKPTQGKQAQTPQPLATVVKLGANDLQNVEVISGVKAGDVISLSEPGAKSQNFQMMMR